MTTKIALVLAAAMSGALAAKTVLPPAAVPPQGWSAGEVLSPFFLISLAILVASVGYAVGAVRKPERRRRDENT